MVNNWTVVGPGGGLPAGCETPMGFLTIQFAASFLEMVPSPNGAKSPATYCDYISQTGIPGQNTETPSEKVFTQHFVIMYTKMGQNCMMSACYYDPSYGVTFLNEAGFQTGAVFGFVQRLPGMNALKGRVSPQNPAMGNITFTAVPL